MFAVLSTTHTAPPFGGFNVPQKRIFSGDSKTSLEPLCLTPDQLKERLDHRKDALQELILESNRDHIITGKSYNSLGYCLQLFEHLDRKCTVGEMVASSEGTITERSVSTAIPKINGILYALLGLRIAHDKDNDILRFVNESDVIQITEKLEKRISKLGKEWAQVSSAYKAQGGNISEALTGTASSTLAELGRLLPAA